jgi:heme/copper-type cytochrome/quinol oxidase subunit 3
MVLLVATEGALFLALLAAYFFVRVRSGGEWPQGGIDAPSLAKPSIATALLFVSSAPALLAERAAKIGQVGRTRLALLAALALGGGFLALQIWDADVHMREFTPHTNAYGSLFYTITGLHGAHVVIGLALLAWCLVLSLAGLVTPARNLAVQNTALYWHFANLTWLVLYGSLYVSVAA